MTEAPIRVLLDISPACAPAASRTGLARVALGLASALARRADVDLTVTAWGWVQAAFDLPTAVSGSPTPLKHARFRSAAIERGFSRSWRRHASNGAIPRWLVSAGQAINLLRNPVRGLNPKLFDIVHSTYSRVPRHVRRWGKPVVMTLHDLTPLRLPAMNGDRSQAVITTRIVRSVKPSDWLVPISDHTKRDFCEVVAPHPEDRTVVIPDGLDHVLFKPIGDPLRVAEARRRHRIPDGPFALTMSSLAPHKNLPFLLRLWPRVRSVHPHATLVVAGGKTTAVDDLAADAGRPDGVHFTGFVPDEELVALLSGCEAFLFPSLYEGFGLPVIEAMASGAPVIASNRASIPEVGGDAATLVDPEDPDAWVESICALLGGAPREGVHAPSIQQASRFSWDRVAGEYAALYERATRAG